ncbi:helicase-related protein [Mucilaginibacter rubeus]|uniref:helicase-related protein n=1 Tax=Mucilaginibacter rubeus TaxID=2027860 RepID=UPI001664CD0B|nr:helicase-related protein [Mucilaginibacter rubeus]GGA95165.1 ATP-dependent helicase [Mucilaginibacter rubeus]
MLETKTHNIAAGIRLSLRDEDFLVTHVEKDIIEVEGISELVKGMRFTFDLSLEDFDVITPESTKLIADNSNGYRKSKLFIETVLRNSSFFSEGIEIANKAAIRPSNYQFIPTIKALSLPKPRILIADAVGLGKTIEVGIFLTEMIRRGKGQRILVVTPKSILSQFQQEVWSRFSIPLVRLDSQGVARITTIIPSNKNPFDYYDKVIVSVDTLKNNGKFRHYLEKIKWDIIVIDECHTVANEGSDRGKLAKFLSQRCEALVLTSATPHNGKKKNFANLITLLDPTAIPYNGEFTAEDITPLYVRRFKKDVESEVGDSFRDRVTTSFHASLFPEEESVIEKIQRAKGEAFDKANGNMSDGSLLFTIGLFKSYMSSPSACLETISNRLEKQIDEEITKSFLLGLQAQLDNILKINADGKLAELITQLKASGWKGRKTDDRIIIFTERRKTLDYLEEKLKAAFNIDEAAIVQFNGSLTDTEQQDIIEKFSKEESPIRLFLTSDAGSQGVNLHYHCHKMFNYDIPWSIITLEQRNGRIDRFGQKNTPYIYYLISKSDNPTIKDDFRILDKLKEKEEEVYKTLGDAASLWMLYDTNKEEKLVTRAFVKGDVSILDKKQKDDEIDWNAVYDVSEETELSKENIFEKPHSSFYSTDFQYYSTVIDELKSVDEKLRDKISVDPMDQLIEFVQTEELCGKRGESQGVLYDIPDEAFPDKRDTFKLTCDKEAVEKSIERARKKEGWPTHQLLYDMHPLARWLQYKILARIDKGNAPVARMRSPLPDKSAWFIFQGISSNGKGQAILSKLFVIGRSFIGRDVGNLDSFDDFVSHYRLFDDLPTLEIEQAHLDILQAMLPDAVTSAKRLYTQQLQGNLVDDIEDKLTEYERKLNKWLQNSERQLDLQFGEDSAGAGRSHKDKRKKDIDYVHKETDEFYKTFFQLEEDPYLRLLAVFYNA